MLSAIRLITLDLDDTLWPCMPTIHRAEAHMYQWLTQNAPLLTAEHSLDALREHRIELASRRPEIAHDLTELRRLSLRQLLSGHVDGSELADVATKEFCRLRNQVEPYEEVLTVLTELRQRYMLISVTNGNADIRHTPLHGCFDHSLTAAEVGAAKPDPALFDAARSLAGVEAHQALHVGDDPLRDVEAARLAGLRTAWVDRGRISWPQQLDPADYIVGNLQELASLL
jgi:HAD superfamily hydrolase (TIGR01509 family)